jgi:uncharacterized protein (DUF983 family)
VAKEIHTCPACDGDGWTFKGFSFDRITCEACKGLGTVVASPFKPSARLIVAFVTVIVLAVICACAARW